MTVDFLELIKEIIRQGASKGTVEMELDGKLNVTVEIKITDVHPVYES